MGRCAFMFPAAPASVISEPQRRRRADSGDAQCSFRDRFQLEVAAVTPYVDLPDIAIEAAAIDPGVDELEIAPLVEVDAISGSVHHVEHQAVGDHDCELPDMTLRDLLQTTQRAVTELERAFAAGHHEFRVARL